MPLRRLPAQQDGLHILSGPPDPACRIVVAREQNKHKIMSICAKIAHIPRKSRAEKCSPFLPFARRSPQIRQPGRQAAGCRPAHYAPVQSKLFAFFTVAADPQVECNDCAQCLAAFAARPVSKQHKTRRSCGRAMVNFALHQPCRRARRNIAEKRSTNRVKQ